MQNIQLLPLESRPQIRRLLTDLGIPEEIAGRLHFCELARPVMKEINAHYNTVDQNSYHRNRFSKQDYGLAWLAEKYGMTVLSSDRDLLHQIHKHLTYTVLDPAESGPYPADGIFLVDTNVIIGMLARDQKSALARFKRAIARYPGVIFALPDFIVAEIISVAKWEGIGPYRRAGDHAPGHRTQANRRGNIPHSFRNQRDWCVCNRYRHLIKNGCI